MEQVQAEHVKDRVYPKPRIYLSSLPGEWKCVGHFIVDVIGGAKYIRGTGRGLTPKEAYSNAFRFALGAYKTWMQATHNKIF